MHRPNPIQINIPTPCHEDWSKMTPTEQGRFCDSCKKCVVDFRGLSDKAIYEYVAQHKDEHICGRFYSNQLNRSISLPPQPHSRLYRYFIGLGLTLLFTQMPIENLRAKAPYANVITQDNNDLKTDDNNSIKIFGCVLDEQRTPVPGAIIVLSNVGQPIGSIVTDEFGNFEIEISKERVKDSILYQKVSSIGYKPNITKLSRLYYNRYQEIKLSYDIKGGMEFIEIVPQRVPLIDELEPSKTVISDDDIEHMAH